MCLCHQAVFDDHSVADWSGGISVALHRYANCSLLRAMDGRIMRRGIIAHAMSDRRQTVYYGLRGESLHLVARNIPLADDDRTQCYTRFEANKNSDV